MSRRHFAESSEGCEEVVVTGVDHDLSDNNEQAKHTEVILSLTTELALHTLHTLCSRRHRDVDTHTYD